MNRTFLLRLIFLAVVSVAIGLVTYILWPVHVRITGMGIPAGGFGPCVGPSLYDRNGNKQNLSAPGPRIPAPLYLVSEESLQVISTAREPVGCYIYPETIPPALALQGQTIYPVVLENTPVDEQMSSGSSTLLIATASITDTFDASRAVQYVIPFTITAQIPARLQIDTTTFDFSPKNEEVLTQTLTAYQHIEQRWVISPRTDKLGKQSINIRLVGPVTPLPSILGIGASVGFEVTPQSGIPANWASIGTTLAAFIAGLAGFVGILRILPDLYHAYFPRSGGRASNKRSRNQRK